MLGTTLIERYYIICNLEGTGLGQSYLAEDRQRPGNPQCVIQQLKPQATDPFTLQTARSIFNSEAQVLYKLGNHTQIPGLLAHFEDHQVFYLVQEFIEGHDLTQEITPGKPMSEAEVVLFLNELLQILAFVHQQQVIHYNIKPSNIRRRSDNQIVLIDFGAVKQLSTQVQNSQGMRRLTVNLDTPGYMPSEQAQGKPKLSSDIYAVGIIAIQALTGLDPQQNQLREDPRTGEILWRDQVKINASIADILDKMVRYDFRERYSSATEALEALQKTGFIQFYQQTSIGESLPNSPTKSPKTDDPELLLQQGAQLWNKGEQEEAIADLDKAAKMQPEYVKSWFERVDTLYNLLSEVEAETSDKKVQPLPLKPTTSEAERDKVGLIKLQQYEKSVVTLNKLIEQQANNYLAWYYRGDALIKLNRYEEAIAAYNQAIQIEPSALGGWPARLVKLKELQRTPEAIQLCHQIAQCLDNKVIQTSSDSYAQWKRIHVSWYRLGNYFQEFHCYNQAASAYNQAIKIKRDDYKSWYWLGYMQEHLQSYPKAIACYNEAITIKSDFQEAIDRKHRVQNQLSK